MKILHVAEYTKGGVATILSSLITHQEKLNGSKVSLLIEKTHTEYVDCKDTYVFNGGRSLIGLIRFGFSIISSYLKVKPDVVHLHSSFAGLVGRIALSPFRVKIVYQPHGISFDSDRVNGFKKHLYQFIEKFLSNNMNKMIAISEYEYDQLSRILGKSKLVLINNGVPDTSVDINLIRNGRLLFVGRLDEQKGLDLLLNLYKEGLIDKSLDIVGESVLKDSDYDLDIENVTFLGWKSQKELEMLYSDYDAVIMPSRWEGFGLVAIESLRSGTPVLCSNRGALPYLIEDNRSGFVFNLQDYEQSIPESIKRLQNTSFESLSLHSRKVYLEKYTSVRMCEETFQLYKQIK